MKKQSTIKLGRKIALSALVGFGFANFAQADMANTYKEEGLLNSGYFSSLESAGKTNEFDQSMYDKVNLGPLSSTLLTPKRGAQGPIREDAMREEERNQLAKQWSDVQRQLGPIGGHDTP